MKEGFHIVAHGAQGGFVRVYEGDVPIIICRPINDEYAQRAEDTRLHRYQVFDHAFNGTLA